MVNHSRLNWAPIVAACVFVSSAAAQATTGATIRGVVQDREFHTPVADATVTVLGTNARTVTRADGSYSIANVPEGTYTIVISKDGYVREVRANVIVRAGQLVDADAALAGEFEDMEEFVVQDMNLGKDPNDIQRVLDPMDLVPFEYYPPIDFQLRLSDPSIMDIVGVEMISKSGASDAASILLLVPGASLQDGKYAVVRGLPDRYVSTLLDGVRLPTADPDKRAVKLDQFPAAVIESIQVAKSFTPDQQGDASGGAVNIDLKDIPDAPFFQIKTQIGFNSQVKDGEFLTYRGGRMSYFGESHTLSTHPDQAGVSWPDNPTSTMMGNPPIIHKWSVATGSSWELDDGVKIGASGNFFYDQDASAFDNGKLDSLEQAGPGTPLIPEQFGTSDNFKTQLFDVTQGTQSVQWGGLGSFGIESEDHKLSAKFLYTSLSENQAIRLIDTRGKAYYFPGYDPNDLTGIGHDVPEQAPYNRLETLDYSQLGTQSFILHGSHKLSFMQSEKPNPCDTFSFLAPEVDWRFSLSKATEHQPDQTQFASYWVPDFQIFPGFVIPQQWIAYPPAQNAFVGWVQHISYNNSEDSTQGTLNFKLPFIQWNDREGYFKAGVFADSVTRSYYQNTFSNGGDPNTSYSSAFNDPWSAVFPSQDHPINQSETDISYDGFQDITAFYAMFDVPVTETINIIGGARLEKTTMSTTILPDEAALWINVDTQTLQNFLGPNEWDADFKQDDLLPMIGCKWEWQPDLIFRTSFAQTIARPNFYEMVPVLQYDYIGGPIFIGNPELGMSSLNNYDVRLDWLPFENWLISGSTFFKQIKDPIQYVQRFTEGFSYTTAMNFPSGTLFGAELESRLTLDPILGDEFRGLALGANFTWMTSEVRLSPADQQALADYGVFETTQPMTATPDFLLNLNCTYEIVETGTQLGIFYNFKGDSLVSGANPHTVLLTPAIYQNGYGTLNLTAAQELLAGLKLSMTIKNLLNPEISTEYRTSEGNRGLNSSYTSGIAFSFALTYQITF